MLRVLFCGGGSIGHLAPSIAVWEALQEKEKDAKALFVCSMRMADRRFLARYSVSVISVIAPKCGNILDCFLFPVFFPFSLLHAFLILVWFRPHVIFAKGGYVSVPLCLVGWLLRRPIVLHESDRVMGRANRLLLHLAKHLCIGTPQKEIADEEIMTRLGIAMTATGNPIRKQLLTGSKDGGRRVTGFSGKRPSLLIIGGSQGAHALNELVWKNLQELLDIADVIHLTGRGKVNKDKKHARYFQRETMEEELQNLYAFADVVVSRAGAGVIAELSALRKATILVPIPGLASKHQEENAHFLEVANAVVVLDQKMLKETLVPTLKGLLQNEQKRRELGERLHTFATPDAAQRIANILLETAKK